MQKKIPVFLKGQWWIGLFLVIVMLVSACSGSSTGTNTSTTVKTTTNLIPLQNSADKPGCTQPTSPYSDKIYGCAGPYTSFSASILIGRPRVDDPNGYSQATATIVDTTINDNHVEAGWRQNGGTKTPFFFIAAKINGNLCTGTQCQDNGYYVEVAKPIPGDLLSPQTNVVFTIQHSSSDKRWEILINSKLVGYFPDKLWNSTFLSGNKWFFIAEADSQKGVCQIGSGSMPPSGNAATISNLLANGQRQNRNQIHTFSSSSSYPIYLNIKDDSYLYGGSDSCQAA